MPSAMETRTPVEITALLGRGTRFEGKLFFRGRVRIDGQLRGEIHSEDVLVVGEGADIEADIEVDTVIVKGGKIRGNIRARTAIELHVPAHVVGNLHSPSLVIEKGVTVEGSCTMAPLPDDPPPIVEDIGVDASETDA